MVKRENKETTVSFRLDNSWASALKNLSTKQNKKKSEIFRDALMLYYFITDETDPETINSIFNQKVMSFLFENLPDDKVSPLAQIAYQTGVKHYFNILPNIQNLGIDLETTPENMIKILVENVFPQNKNHWFEQVEYHIDEKTNIIEFHGKHYLGDKFSDFIKFMLIRYFQDYKYSLMSETFQEIKEIHKDSKKETSFQIIYSITLKFSPEK